MSNLQAVISKDDLMMSSHQATVSQSLASLINPANIILPIDLDSLYKMFDQTNDRNFYNFGGGSAVGGGGESTRCCASGTCDFTPFP